MGATLHTAHCTLRTRLDSGAPRASQQRQPAACSQQPAARKPAGRTHAPRRPSCQPRSPRRFLSLLSIRGRILPLRGRILPLHLLPPNLHLPPRCHADGVAAYLPALSGLVRPCTKRASQRRRLGPSRGNAVARGDNEQAPHRLSTGYPLCFCPRKRVEVRVSGPFRNFNLI